MPEGPRIPAELPVEVLQRQSDWTEVRCSNGWSAWVDGRLLLEMHAVPLPNASVPGPPALPSTLPALAAPAPSTSGGEGLSRFLTNAAWRLAVPASTIGRVVLGTGVVVLLTGFFPWFSVGNASATAWRVPVSFLVDPKAQGSPWLAWLLLLVGGSIGVLALRGRGERIALVAGGVVAAVGLLFIISLLRAPGAGLGNVGLGAWLTVLAGAGCASVPTIQAKKGAAHPTPATPPTPSATLPTTPATLPTTSSIPSVAAPPEADAGSGWTPTHRVPVSGLDCFSGPDPGRILAVRLDGGLLVRVDETAGDWVRVGCSNGWTAWVDGRQLTTIPR